MARPGGELLYREATSLMPEKRSPLGRGLLGDTPATVGTLLILSDISPEAVRDAVCEALMAEPKSGALTGVSVLPGGGGICVKALASELAPVTAALRLAWRVAREQLWGAGLPQQRKY